MTIDFVLCYYILIRWCTSRDPRQYGALVERETSCHSEVSALFPSDAVLSGASHSRSGRTRVPHSV